ncbi:MAG: HNH endonuclease, partial [Elioraea sp.]|nr:HNH endonuclease [Elioraea sp.]
TRFHLVDCTTLENMRIQKRFERYVVTNRYRGPLRVFLRDEATRQVHEAEMELRVCKNCLKALNWQGFASAPEPRKTEIWLGFSREAFLEKYSPTFATRPRRRDTDGPDAYPPHWSLIRDQALKQAAYRCARCGVVAPRAQQHLVDVHHINGAKSDNNPANLKVLCKLCHAGEPGHGH